MSRSENGASLGRQVRSSMARELRQKISDVEGLVVAKVERVATRDLNALRATLGRNEASFLMIKNSLCRKVLNELGVNDLEQFLRGSCGVSPIHRDTPQACKLLVQFAKDHEGFVLQGGVLAGKFLGPQEIGILARLPSREVLIGQVVGALQAPLSGLLHALKGVQGKLVFILERLSQLKE